MDIEARLLNHRPLIFVKSAQSFIALLRCPWRWGNTCSHSEHRSQAQQRRLYCHKWETSTVPNYKRDLRIGGLFSLLRIYSCCRKFASVVRNLATAQLKHTVYMWYAQCICHIKTTALAETVVFSYWDLFVFDKPKQVPCVHKNLRN